jgi:RNA polymerase sigma factor (sigma-70 family)
MTPAVLEKSGVATVEWQSPDFWRRFRSGDPAILEAVYWRFVDVVEHVLGSGFVTKDGRRLIAGVRDPDQRRDLLQECFLKAFSASARQTFDERLDYRPYLLTIARNVLADHYRGRRRDTSMSDAVDDQQISADNGPAPEPSWAAPSLLPVVERFVAGLESPLREIHEARFIQGKSQREAARALGLSRQSMRTLEARLKDCLRDALEDARHAEAGVRAALDDQPDGRWWVGARSR